MYVTMYCLVQCTQNSRDEQWLWVRECFSEWFVTNNGQHVWRLLRDVQSKVNQTVDLTTACQWHFWILVKNNQISRSFVSTKSIPWLNCSHHCRNTKCQTDFHRVGILTVLQNVATTCLNDHSVDIPAMVHWVYVHPLSQFLALTLSF